MAGGLRELTEEEKGVCNRALGDMWAMGHATRNFLYYLVHPDLDGERNLRNLMFCHMADSLLEAAAEAENRINAIERDAKRLNLQGVSKNTKFWRIYCDGIAHTFGVLSDEELVFIQYFRDQFLHGREFGYQPKRSMHMHEPGRISTKKISSEAVSDIVGKICEEHLGWQGGLLYIRRKYMIYKSFFWTLAACANLPEFNEGIRREIYEDRTDLVHIEIEPGGFLATHDALQGQDGLLWRLIDQRELVRRGPSSAPDPLFAELEAQAGANTPK